MSNTWSGYPGIASLHNFSASQYKALSAPYILRYLYISNAKMAAIFTQSNLCIPPLISIYKSPYTTNKFKPLKSWAKIVFLMGDV